MRTLVGASVSDFVVASPVYAEPGSFGSAAVKYAHVFAVRSTSMCRSSPGKLLS